MIAQSTAYFEENRMMIPELKYEGVADTDAIEVCGSPGKRCFINFPTKGTMVELMGISPARHSSENNMEVSEYSNLIMEYLGVRDTVGPTNPKIREKLHDLIPFCCGNPAGFDASIMKRAVHLACIKFTRHIDTIVAKAASRKIPLDRGYTVNEVINGIDGGARSRMKMDTSDGFGRKKNSWLSVNVDGTYCLDESKVEEYLNFQRDVCNGVHPGLFATMQNKIEAKEVKLTGDPEPIGRLFVSVDMCSYLLTMQMMGPQMDIMKENPTLFHTAVGMDIASPQWGVDHEILLQEKFRKNVMGVDFKSYDACQTSVLRDGEGMIWMKLATLLGWEPILLDKLKKVLALNNSSMVKVDGTIVDLKNLFLSGLGPTAIGNGLRSVLCILYTIAACEKESGVFLTDDEFEDNVYIESLGDDNQSALTDKIMRKLSWSPSKMKDILDTCGMLVTAADKSASLKQGPVEEAGFLRSHLTYNSDLDININTRKPESMFKSAIYRLPPTNGSVAHTTEMLENMLMSAGATGREGYEYYRYGKPITHAGVTYTCKGVEELCKAANLPMTTRLSASYDDWVAERKEAFRKMFNGEEYPRAKLRSKLVNPMGRYIAEYNEKPIYVPTRAKFRRDLCISEQAVCKSLDTPNIVTNEMGPESVDVVDVVETTLFPTQPRNNIATMLSRKVNIATIQLPSSEIFTLYPYTLFLENVDMSPYVTHQIFMASGISLEFSYTRAAPHYGTQVCCWIPRSQSRLFDTLSYDLRMHSAMNYPHVVLQFSEESTSAVLEIPFMHDHPMIRITTQALNDLGCLKVLPLNPLMHSHGMSVPVVLTIKATLNNLKLGEMSTAAVALGDDISMPESSEKLSGKLQNFSEIISEVGKILPGPAGSAMQAAGAGGSAIAGVAAKFGYSKPPITQASPVQLSLLPNMANSNGGLPTEVLGLDVTQNTMGNPGNCGDTFNGDFEDLKRRFGFFHGMQIGPGVPPNSEVFRVNVTPAICADSRGLGGTAMNTEANLIPLGCAMPLLYTGCWHGGMEFKFECVAPMGASTKLAVAVMPDGDTRYSPQVHDVLIVNIGEGVSEFHVYANYAKETTLLHGFLGPGRTEYPHWSAPYEKDFHNGVLRMFTLTSLVSSGMGEPVLYVNVYARAMKDMQYFFPTKRVASYFTAMPRAIVSPPAPGYGGAGETLGTGYQFTNECISTRVVSSGIYCGPELPPMLAPPMIVYGPETPEYGAVVTSAPTAPMATTSVPTMQFNQTASPVNQTFAPTIMPALNTSAPTSSPVGTSAPTVNCTTTSKTSRLASGHMQLDGTQRHINGSRMTVLNFATTTNRPQDPSFDATYLPPNLPHNIEMTTYVEGGIVDFTFAVSNGATITITSTLTNLAFSYIGNTVRVLGTSGFSGFINVYFTMTSTTSQGLTSITHAMPGSAVYSTYYADSILGGTMSSRTLPMTSAATLYTVPTRSFAGPGEYFTLEPTLFPPECGGGYGTTYAYVTWHGNREIGTDLNAMGRLLEQPNGVPQWSNTGFVTEQIRVGEQNVYMRGVDLHIYKVTVITFPSMARALGEDSEMEMPSLTYGKAGNNDNLAAIVAGENVLSMRTLMKRPQYLGSIVLDTVANPAICTASASVDYYNPPGEYLMYPTDYIARCVLGTRGGMDITMLAQVADGLDATIFVAMAESSELVQNMAEGAAILDTRVNPTLCVKAPYREKTLYSFTDPDRNDVIRSSRTMTFCACTTQPTRVIIHRWGFLSEDFEYLNFLGGAILRKAG